VSQIGMLPGTVAYVLAGTQLGAVQRLQDVLSPSLLVAFAALGLLPLVLQRVVETLRARRVYAGWPRPRRFDRNVVVIGAGAAGLVASYVAAAVRARVTLVERERMGGDCLNTGCVPSKALIRTATFLSQVRHSAEFGVRSASAEFDFADVMARVRRVVDEIAPHDSVERYTGLGVECLAGEARITSPWTVEVRSGQEVRTLSTRAIVIATGARPRVPPIPGIEAVGCLTSDTLWSLRELPGRLLVLGGGPIGCELAQAFARLGSRVCLVESAPRLLAREDGEVSEAVAAALRADGVSLHLGWRVTSFVVEDGVRLACCDAGATSERLAFDTLLCAVGRVARVEGFGLEDLGIAVSPAGTLEVDAFMATRFPNILACGDVAGPWQFTHMAAHTAWYASVNGLFGGLRRFRADMRLVPRATFTDPEVASVGLNETAARAAGVQYEVTTYGFEDLDRAIVDGEARGSVKVLTAPGRDRILGVTIVGHHAGDLLAEFVLAMRQGIGLNRILGTIHVYPTLAEASKAVAGRWRQAHAPARALRWLERFHAWRRG
jgi:pyruvate/2-oxoglutarate dehydrogenase complex dihydrolipoamide dehydrogenase (E3) component